MSYLYCPYCDAQVEVCHDDGFGYAEGVLHEYDCGNCGKNFVFETCISLDYYPKKADCLNDGEHKYEKTNTIPAKYARLKCNMCGHEKPLPKDSHD